MPTHAPSTHIYAYLQDESKAEFAAFAAKDDGKGVKDFMGSMGLGGVLSQLEASRSSLAPL